LNVFPSQTSIVKLAPGAAWRTSTERVVEQRTGERLTLAGR
jgi:hypothetical protein